MAVRLTRAQLEQILAQARAEAPNECCGVLLGRGDTVEEVFPGRNVDETPETRYYMHNDDVRRALDLLDERGWDLVAIYHSHPKTAPKPSATDKALVAYPNARYVIVSLQDPMDPKVRAWRMLEKADDRGKPVTDGNGNVIKLEREEDVLVT